MDASTTQRSADPVGKRKRFGSTRKPHDHAKHLQSDLCANVHALPLDETGYVRRELHRDLMGSQLLRNITTEPRFPDPIKKHLDALAILIVEPEKPFFVLLSNRHIGRQANGSHVK